MEWLSIFGPILAFGSVAFSVIWTARAKRPEQAAVVKTADVAEATAAESALAARFDDASQLAQYIREEVERQVAPIRIELDKVKNESHEMNDAVRARETQLWLWEQRGRAGNLPMLPGPILHKLGLGYIAEGWITDPTPAPPGSSS